MTQGRIDPNQIFLNENSLSPSVTGLSVKLDPSGFLTESPTGIQLTPDNVGTLVRETILYGPLSVFEVAQGYFDFITIGGQADLISSGEVQIVTAAGTTSPPQVYGEQFTFVWDSANEYKRITWDPAYSATFGTAPTLGLIGDLQTNDYLVIGYYRLGTSGDLTPACESLEFTSPTTASASFTQLGLMPAVQMRSRKIKFSVSGTNLQLNGNTSVDFRFSVNNVDYSPQFANGIRYTQNLGSFHFETMSTQLATDGLNDLRLEWRTAGGNLITADQLIFNILEAR